MSGGNSDEFGNKIDRLSAAIEGLTAELRAAREIAAEPQGASCFDQDGVLDERHERFVKLVTDWNLVVGEWEGTSSQMLERLEDVADDHEREHVLPVSPRGLSVMLRKVAGALSSSGVSVSMYMRESGSGPRLIRIRAVTL